MIGGQPSLASHFRAALDGAGLHVAAHSHHPWPDVTRAAHLRAWDLAAAELDDKWHTVLDQEVPRAQRYVARLLELDDPGTVAFAQNTHDLLVRICSDLPAPMRVLTTDGEFHSAARQLDRWAEAGLALVERVPVEPFATFPERFIAAMGPEQDLVLFSHVFYNSGYVVPDVPEVVQHVPGEHTYVVVDGYHAFMALPTSLAPVQDRAFYLAGGYKYAMAGEGAAFAVAPPGYAARPVHTGWFASFGTLSDGPAQPGAVRYRTDGSRLAGSTFDPSGLFRFNAVQQWLDDLGVGVPDIHDHVRGLQARFLASVDQHGGALTGAVLLPGPAHQRGHFLTYRTADAERLAAQLAGRGVRVDHRGDRLRLGFGVYHSTFDVDRLVEILTTLS